MRAAVVLRQDPNALPPPAQAAIAEGEQTIDEIPAFGVLCFGFDESVDRAGLYMDFDRSCLLKDVDGADSQEAAETVAARWVGDGGIKVPFRNIPGVYQVSFVELVTGAEQADTDMTELMWALPENNGFCAFREFPPRTKPTDVTPDPGSVSFGLLPVEAVQAMYKNRGW